MARGKRPVSFRTRKLSLSAPMVLPWRRGGRVGRRRTTIPEGAPASVLGPLSACPGHRRPSATHRFRPRKAGAGFRCRKRGSVSGGGSLRGRADVVGEPRVERLQVAPGGRAPRPVLAARAASPGGSQRLRGVQRLVLQQVQALGVGGVAGGHAGQPLALDGPAGRARAGRPPARSRGPWTRIGHRAPVAGDLVRLQPPAAARHGAARRPRSARTRSRRPGPPG